MIQSLFIQNITATDVTRQRRVRARRVPMDSTMQDLVRGLLPRLRLPLQDSGGRALTYHARIDRLGRHAHSTETVGDVLLENDEISLHPNIDAGGIR